MRTEVIMKRKIFDQEISQKSKSEYFSATDLVRAGNKWRKDNNLSPFNMSLWLKTKSTKDFIEELNNQNGEKALITGRGRGNHTWVHPYLFIDMALAISPKLKIEVYKWLYDHLIEYRNNSGDSYKKMCGALWQNCKDKSKFKRGLLITADRIKSACDVDGWQQASEEQLKKRDRIHENISLLCDVLRDNNEAIRLGILKAKQND